MKIAIVDYGMGNLFSVNKALQHVAQGAEIILTDKPAIIDAADKVVFPGQGAMPDCMRELAKRNLSQSVIEAASHKPFLGICVGAQLLFEHSEEGPTAGLGIFPGQVVRFKPEAMHNTSGNKHKVPHMGWNEIAQISTAQPHPLWQGIANNERFYFVHSYHFMPSDDSLILGQTAYPSPFASVIGRKNIFAMQCHPEKSHTAGLTLLRNFVAWSGTV